MNDKNVLWQRSRIRLATDCIKTFDRNIFLRPVASGVEGNEKKENINVVQSHLSQTRVRAVAAFSWRTYVCALCQAIRVVFLLRVINNRRKGKTLQRTRTTRWPGSIVCVRSTTTQSREIRRTLTWRKGEGQRTKQKTRISREHRARVRGCRDQGAH